MRQRVVLERVERCAEPRVAAELRQRRVGFDQRHLVDVAPLPDAFSRALGLLERRVRLHVHRDVERAVPAAAGDADVLHQHVQARGQGERDADHHDRQHRRERVLPQPPE
jgi:hypothetical protein